MSEIKTLLEGQVPEDPENFVLIELIPAPRGAPRYRVTAEGTNKDGLISFSETCDSLEVAHAWAAKIVQAWQSRPPVYRRAPLGGDE